MAGFGCRCVLCSLSPKTFTAAYSTTPCCSQLSGNKVCYVNNKQMSCVGTHFEGCELVQKLALTSNKYVGSANGVNEIMWGLPRDLYHLKYETCQT